MIGVELGLKISGKSATRSNRRNFPRHRVYNALHLRSSKGGVTRQNSEDKFISQSDDQTAGTRSINVFDRFAFMPLLNKRVGLILENSNGIEQNHGSPKILPNTVRGLAGKLFNTKLLFETEICGFNAPTQAIPAI